MAAQRILLIRPGLVVSVTYQTHALHKTGAPAGPGKDAQFLLHWYTGTPRVLLKQMIWITPFCVCVSRSS